MCTSSDTDIHSSWPTSRATVDRLTSGQAASSIVTINQQFTVFSRDYVALKVFNGPVLESAQLIACGVTKLTWLLAIC